MSANTQNDVRDTVREGYAAIARENDKKPAASGCCTTACCGTAETDAAAFAAKVGYDPAELANIPEGANMGLSCGNPTAIAALQAGECVVDLGSGGGFDCFIAGPKVGATGRVIGVDMTPDMLGKARRNVTAYQERTQLENVEFRLGEIEHLPIADNTVDVVISNCVINLSPDKPQVWREIARVLKPGGRVAVSDLALIKPLPEAVRADAQALVGCIAGAILVSDTKRYVEEAGLTDIQLEKNTNYVKAMAEVRDPLYQKILAALPEGETPADYITQLSIAAKKPE